MGGIPEPERSSLDRLKALDSHPDLESQLQEAKSLCNHNSRAEMISRWLLGKLKASDEARTESACWELLSSCLRIISTSRIAYVLGSNGFIDSLQTTCSASDLPTETMDAISRSLNLLFELCDQDSGTAIKALLHIDSSIAADICGNWFRLVYETLQGTEKSTSSPSYSLLEPALKLWSLRKRRGSDDELFTAKCSVSALLLLEQVQAHALSDSHKRKRGSSNAFDARAARHAIDSLLAKHVVLPARSVFFKDRESYSVKSRRRPTEASQPERLGPLKMAVLRQDGQKMGKAIPLLLDIALRSVATPTPRHRFNERPWVESLLAALRGCFAAQDRALQNQVLAKMLDVIHREGHQISSVTLLGVAKDDAFPSQDPTEVDWNLLAKIIRLDANVLCDKTIMETLFNALTTYQSSAGEGETTESLAEDIAVPVMKAHAKGRTLSLFVDCWIEQLARSENQTVQSIWTDLAATFSEICEEAMTPEQILSLFEKLASSVNSIAASSKLSNDPLLSHQLFASLTVLNGLLSGIRNDTTINKLQDGLDALHRSLQSIGRSKTMKKAGPLTYQLWTLSTRVFDLWFPSWAVQQKDRGDVVDIGLADDLQGALKTALTQCTSKGDSPDAPRIAQAAQMFVANISTCFGRYDESKKGQSLCAEFVERLSQQSNDALPIVLAFPSLLAHVKFDVRKVVSHLLDQTRSSDKEDQERSISQLGALICTASNLPQRPVFENIVAALLDRLRGDDSNTLSSQLELLILSAFSAIDLAAQGLEQRVAMLDTLLQLQPPPSTQLGSNQLQHRLALMASLLRQSCRGSRLLTDAEGIWDIVSWFRDTRIGKKTTSMPAFPLDSLNNLEVFDEVARLLVGSLVSTRNQKSTQEMIARFSEQTKKRIEQLRSGKDITPATRTASLVLFKNIFGAVGQGDSKALVIDQGSDDATVLYLSALAAEFKSFVSMSKSDLLSIWTEGGKSGPLLWIFDALVAIPDGMRPSPSGMELADAVKSLAYCMLEWEHNGLPEAGFPELSRIKVASFQVACKYDPTAGQRLLPLAQKLLQRDLTAREHLVVLSTFENTFKADDDEWTVALQRMVLDQQDQTPATLMLQQRAIKTLSDEDLEGSPTGVGHLRGTESFTAFQIFDHTLSQALTSTTLQAKQIALQTLAIIFKEKSFMVNQYGIEQTLAMLHNILKTYKHASALYTDICNILSALFAAYRSRLQGRFHLLTALFQALLTRLFTNSHSNTEVPIRHAKVLARLLESFCNPQIRQRSNNNKSNSKAPSSLVDEARKAQARAGQYAQYILHHYCSQLLTGSSPQGVREALRPGVWTIIEAMESYNPEGIKVLSAAMNAGERAVLRGVYEDWRRFGKWEGL